MKLILASQSPYRLALLNLAGLNPTAVRPLVDEEQLKITGPKDLKELASFLAKEKAKSVAHLYPDAFIIGSDQMVELQGARLDKPHTIDQAEAQLHQMSGKTHQLITAVALVTPSECKVVVNVSEITFKHLSPVEIQTYVRLDRPLDSAGSYKIEKAGIALIETLKTSDPTAIQGLPMIELFGLLREAGYKLEDLWSEIR